MMKHCIITIVLLCLYISLTAQNRYLDEVFCEIEVLTDVEYCTQIDPITASLDLDTTFSKTPLLMDVYLPVDDNLAERPLILYVPTGNFLQFPVNGTNGGGKQDSCIVEMCTQLAQRGYVVASVDHRLGWNPISIEPEKRKIMKAWYRAMQDVKTANRFFRKDYETNNQYGIDTSKIIVWGQGTGGLVSTGIASLDQYQELLLLPDFFITTNLGTTEPIISESVYGNIDGTTEGVKASGGYLNLPRYTNYSSKFHLAVQLAGNTIDTLFIDENTLPIVSFQVPNDENYVLNGAYAIHKQLEKYGVNNVFDTESFTDSYTLQALSTTGQTINLISGTIPVNDDYAALYPFLNNLTNSNPWEWFDSTANAASPFPISKANSLLYIDTIMNYFAPRAINVLNIGGIQTNALEITPPVIDFGWFFLGNDTLSIPVTIHNPSATDFQIIPNSDVVNFGTNAPSSLQACGESIEFEVYLHPSYSQIFKDSLVLVSANGSKVVIPITALPAELGGVDQLDSKLISIFPNPSNGTLKIDLSRIENKQHTTIKIYDSSGRILKEESPIDELHELTDLRAGIYFVSIETLDGIVHKKLVVQ